jgi:ABC-2 type transport system ATP-binding protein
VAGYLRLHGWGPIDAERIAWQALERVQLVDAAKRQIAGYSKGMRQRVKLAQSIAHGPEVLILDEPLNGLDPMARAEMIALFQELAREGQHVIISSHILHEVDLISDTVIFVDQGYVVAEGDVQEVRHEMDDIHPMQIQIVCDQPAVLAARLFRADHIVEARIGEDRRSLLASTRDPDSFYLLLNSMVVDEGLEIESVAPADDSVQAVYNYLISNRQETAL